MKLRKDRAIGNAGLIWLFPIFVTLVGVLILSVGWWQRQRTLDETRRFFDGHLNSIESLVTEATREAAAATALMYELTAEQLEIAASMIAAADRCNSIGDVLLRDDTWSVQVVIGAAGTVSGSWGAVKVADRETIVAACGKSLETMTDIEVSDGGRLLCLSHAVGEDTAIVCRNAAQIESLSAETGLPTLLKNVVKEGIIYVALQDGGGILAAAPTADMISTWKSDPALESAMRATVASGAKRLREVAGRPVYEGLIPFAMADGSRALLRIGVDGTALTSLESTSIKRFSMLVGLVAATVVLAFVLAFILSFIKVRQARTDLLLAEREGERRHWEAIGQMASTVAHEVRNPLNTLGMISQRLGREFDVPLDQKKDFDVMISLLMSQSQRVNGIVSDFLELGRPLVMNIESAEAESLLDEAVLQMKFRAEKEKKHLTLENRCSGRVTVDRGRFVQVCSNLIGNALDAVPEGGRVEVTGTCDGEGFTVAIIDDGPGIPAEQLENVMKPFVSLKSGGTGLGLPLVRRYTEAMGGTFVLTSSSGNGTRAEIRLRKCNEQRV